MRRRTKWVIAATALIALVTTGVYLVNAETQQPIEYGRAVEVAKLKIQALHESSGLAASRIHSNVLWSHNDSGDSARLFSFTADGMDAGTFEVRGAKASDWEDMASFKKNGTSYLLVADTGDNSRRRSEYQLYRIPEKPAAAKTLQVDQIVRFTFENGACDCEAIAFDTELDQVILVDKGWDLRCRVYALDWPKGLPKSPLVARQLATLKIAGITGLDISPDGRRAIALTYGPAYEFTRDEGESWKEAFQRKGRLIRMPVRRQGEAICYAADGETLFLTSEQRPTPLFRVATRDEPTEREVTSESASQ